MRTQALYDAERMWLGSVTFRSVARSLAAVLVLLGVLVIAVFAQAFVAAPSTDDLGLRIARYDLVHGALPVPLAKVSPVLRQAVVATEDERFYQHSGVDLIALLRAVPFDVIHLSLAQGASTIAEQLAKLIYLNGNDHSGWRKIQEITLGYRIGHGYSHERILEAYLNSVYLGENQYGVEAASEHYFGRSASRLDLREASVLAGLIQAPSAYDPQANPQAARSRQVDVLRAMVRDGYIAETEARAAVGVPLELVAGARLPAVPGVGFAPGAPFDWGELLAAALLLVGAVGTLIVAHVAALSVHPRSLARAVSIALVIVSIATAAHSIQVV
jgi:membrane peptidoglycan carboxypeptidase